MSTRVLLDGLLSYLDPRDRGWLYSVYPSNPTSSISLARMVGSTWFCSEARILERRFFPFHSISRLFLLWWLVASNTEEKSCLSNSSFYIKHSIDKRFEELVRIKVALVPQLGPVHYWSCLICSSCILLCLHFFWNIFNTFYYFYYFTIYDSTTWINEVHHV